MKNTKRFMALGLTGAMLLSVGTSAFAAGAGGLGPDTGKQPVRTYTVGDNVPPSQNADVDIHGEIFEALNTDIGTKPTDTTGNGDPTKDSEWGGDKTYGNAYLVVTAPTDITFQGVKDSSDESSLISGTGTITNQSYYQPNPTVEGTSIPAVKAVTMVASATEVNDAADQFTINQNITSGAKGDVSGLQVAFSGALTPAAGSDLTVDYANAALGTYTVAAGTVMSDLKTVAPSIAKLKFAEKTTGFNVFLGDNYVAGSNTKLTAESKLRLSFTYVK